MQESHAIADGGLCKGCESILDSDIIGLRLAPPCRQHSADQLSSDHIPFTAPELLRDANCVDEKCDIFSIAIVMWCLYTGQNPADPDRFRDGREKCPPEPYSPSRKIAKTLSWPSFSSSFSSSFASADPASRPDPARLRWAAFSAVVRRAWAEDPAARPAAEEVLADLEAMLGGGCGSQGCSVA
jgi:hypothetical protein